MKNKDLYKYISSFVTDRYIYNPYEKRFTIMNEDIYMYSIDYVDSYEMELEILIEMLVLTLLKEKEITYDSTKEIILHILYFLEKYPEKEVDIELFNNLSLFIEYAKNKVPEIKMLEIANKKFFDLQKFRQNIESITTNKESLDKLSNKYEGDYLLKYRQNKMQNISEKNNKLKSYQKLRKKRKIL